MALIANKLMISPQALSQEVGGETVILDMNTEQYFTLDDVSTRFWQLLSGDNNLRQVYNTLLREYEVEPAQLEADLNKFVSELIETGLASASN